MTRRILDCVSLVLLVAIAAAGVRTGIAQNLISQLGLMLSPSGLPVLASAPRMSTHEIEALDGMAPQQQAKLLIERGLNGYRGALEQIEARLESWQGQLEPTKELETMLGAAYNANDLRVRAAAIEVSLVAHKVEKSAATAERLRNELPTAEGSKAWRLWMVGLLANRGIETGRAIETLLYYSRDPEEHTRYWAVQALAHIGADSTIEPLLRIMHDDPSHDVRERAACGLAQSGMLTSEQRRQAVPALLRYTDDSSLDETTRKWAFQALRDITGQSLPEDPAAWRNWHARTTAR